ncbi:hypothetical protein [Streptomyces sp. RB17]|uniref:hypothetical protein n=1 Tax=Streptomyces sp. RB17 TaxID=2585197 RepID=UPI001296ED01|nr:hypothetical protein [Streptomyces sp. RB17]
MSAEQLSAVAAIAAAVISLVNVGLSSYLVRKQESQRWTREQLPDIVTKLADAAFRWEVKIFESDWSQIPESDRDDFGMEEATEAMSLVSKMEVFAAPDTISSAHNMLDSIDAIRLHTLQNPPQSGDSPEKPWSLYWKWREAQHSFLSASRKEMGLKPPPIPIGLRRYRERTEGSSVTVPTDSSAVQPRS